MKKRVTLITVIVLLILTASVGASKVDYKVEEELEDKVEVSVVVMLKDDDFAVERSSALSSREKPDLKGALVNRKAMVKRQQEKVLSVLNDFKLKHSYSAINGFSGKITKEGLEKLKNDPNVAKIFYDGVKYLNLDSSVAQINADDVWGLRPNSLNLTGQNQTICVIDSGVDYTHVSLGNCSTANFTNGTCSKVISGWDYVNNDNDPMDDYGHGTHVAGIIISNDTTYKGVAPDANIVALKACNNGGTCVDSDIVSSIDWCIANRSSFNISVITMSLGSTTCYTSPCDDADSVVIAANNATSFSLFVDAAAGNYNASDSCVSSPACGSNLTAVGGVQDDDTTIEYNRAPFMNILAPSQTITSTVLRSGVISDSSGFKSVSGTSMAAPHVAGVAALMLQFNSSLSFSDIRSIMNSTGKAINDSGTIYKRVDALAAIQSMDKIAPVWSNNATNNTAPENNEMIQFNITCNDTIGLSFYIFSWNDSGSWVNISNGTLSGIVQSISVNQTVTATRGNNVYWKFYCNDTNNNWNMTDEYSFAVTDDSPDAPVLNSPANNSILRANYTLLNWTATDPDNNSMNCYVYGGNESNATSLINITSNVVNGSASIFNWTDLNETTYYWKVGCDDNLSNSSNSSIYQFTVAIPPTTHPTLTSVADYDSDGNIELNWSDDGNETGESYRIYRFSSNITTINSSVTNLTAGISNGTGFFEDNITANSTTYWYVLVTVDAAGNYNDSFFSSSLNGTANDTIKPKIPQVINVTSSSSTTTINWTAVTLDINGNPDNFSLSYKIWNKLVSSANLSKALVNETADYIKTVDSSVCSGGYCITTHGLDSTSLYYYFVTSIDDGNNENLTLDNSSTGNYGNVTATSSPSTSSSGGGGGGSSGGGGGGGAVIAKTTNLDAESDFTSGSGHSVKQIQGDEAIFTLDGREYKVSVAKLKTDSVTINVAGATAVFKEGDAKEFDVDNDGYGDVSITLKKISGGRAEINYRMLARVVEEEVEEEPQAEEVNEPIEVVEIEELAEEKPKLIKWFLIIAGSILVILIIIYKWVHNILKSHK